MKAYQLLVTLKHVKPKVWRRFIIPASFDFYDLHSVIQTAMGWTDSHLFNFTIEDDLNGKIIQLVGDEESVQENFAMAQHYMKEPPEKGTFAEEMYQQFIRTQVKLARDVPLNENAAAIPEFRYIYDFGDGWEHEVVMEEIVADYRHDYPEVLEGRGTCPPEDVGGPPGYDYFKSVMKDEAHPEHDHMKAWAEGQGYKVFRKVNVNKVLKEEWCAN